MSTNSSTTNVSIAHNGNYADILEKIESKRAAGEYSPANSTLNSRPSSVNRLEEGQVASKAAQPITHRPTGFKVHIPRIYRLTVVVFNRYLHPCRPILVCPRQHHRR
jgi:hypothetical protein